MRNQLAGILTLAILTLGCSTAERQDMKRSAEEGVDKAGTVMGQGFSSTKVKSTLMASPKLDASQINVDTKGSAVYLRGRVSSQQQKELAVQLAQAMIDKDQALVDELKVVEAVATP